MKKLFRALIPCLLCSAMLAAFAGCGYDVEGLVPHGEKGSMVFLGVNYNESNSLSEGVKVEINFAHETAAQAETAYSVYVGADGSYQSVYTLPLSFATSEEYNAKNIQEDEIVPGVFAYTCSFPQSGVEIGLPATLFEESSGSFSIVLASADTDFSDESSLHAYDLEYTKDGDTVTLGR